MAEVLLSWRNTDSRKRIIDFVAAVTEEGGANYVAPDDRIAVFDNDGTLWSEYPAYFQLLFAIDRLKEMLPDHPEWKDDADLMAVMEGKITGDKSAQIKLLLKVLAVTHAGMTTDEFTAIVENWITTTKHPGTGQLYSQMIFQPMRELLDYLRAYDFMTYIASGGGVDFMRVFAEKVYGIPPQQVIGSSGKTEFKMTDGGPVLMRLPEIDFIDDGPGKPVGINHFIGRRPILAFGNSDGDLEMLQWTAAGDGLHLVGLVHHTDAERESAYDRGATFGGLDTALDEAHARDWVVVDMKKDWRIIHPYEA